MNTDLITRLRATFGNASGNLTPANLRAAERALLKSKANKAIPSGERMTRQRLRAQARKLAKQYRGTLR